MNINKLFRMAVTLVLGAAVFTACVAQDRNNPLDPGGTAFSNSLSNPFAPAFTGTNVVITPPATPWDKVVTLSWPNATNASGYAVYVSATPNKPAAASLDNLTGTNAAVNMVTSGSNFFWIEAKSATNAATNTYLTTKFSPVSGWHVDTSVGVGAPSLRCINIPPGKAFVVVCSNALTTPAATITSYTNQLLFSNWSGVGNSLWYSVIISRPTVNFAWTNTFANPTSVSSFQTQTGVGLTGTPTVGDMTYTITVSNVSDNDGFNAFWIDEIIISGTGANPNWTNNFSGFNDSFLSGDKEK